MGVGRKPIPTELKRVRGNPGRRPLNDREPRPKPTAPPCPSHLGPEARKEWRRVVKELSAVGLVTRLDRAALAAYCQAWERWLDAEAALRKHGVLVKAPSGYPIQSPYLAIANKAMEQMRVFLTEFGMTPSSRSRVTTTSKGDGDQDPAEEFFAGPRAVND